MAPDQLAKQCADAINFYTTAGQSAELAMVTLVLPKGWKAPPKFPRRTLLSDVGGTRVYSLSAMNVLAWLAGNNLVQIEHLK